MRSAHDITKRLLRIVRNLVLLLVILVAGVGAGIGIGIAWLNSAEGRAWLIAEIERSVPDHHLVIHDLAGPLPFAPRIAHASLADAQGVWAELDALAIAIDPSALFDPSLHISALTIDRMTLTRAPIGAAPEESKSEGPRIPRLALPILPFGVRIDQARVDQIILGPQVGDGVFHLTASASLTDNLAALTIDLDDLAPQPNRGLHLAARLDDRDRTPALSLLLTAHLDQRSLHLALEGPLGSAEGALDLTDGDSTPRTLHARLATTRTGTDYRLSATGTIDPGSPLETSQPLPPLPFDLSASVTQGGIATLDHLMLTSPFGQIQATGTFDPTLNTGTLALALDTAFDMAKIAPYLASPPPLNGTVRAAIRFDTHLDDTAQFDLTLGGQDITLSTAQGDLATHLSGTISRDHVRIGGMAAFADFAATPIAVQFDRVGDAIAGRVTLSLPNLAPFSPWLGTSLGGAGDLALDIAGSDADIWSGTLDIHLKAARFEAAPLNHLIGPASHMRVAYRRDPAGRITLTDLAVTTATATAQGMAEIAPNGQIVGRIALAMPTVAPIGPVIGARLGGHLTLTLAATGSLDDPTLSADLIGTDLTVNAIKLSRLAFTAKIPALSHREADLSGTLALPVGTLSLAATLEASRSGTLALRGITLVGPGLSGRGEALITHQHNANSSKLELAVASLAPYGVLLGRDLDGAMHLTLSLFGGKTPGADLAVTLDRGRFDRTTLKSGTSMLHLDDPLSGTLRARGTVDLVGLRSADTLIDHTTLKVASGPEGHTALTLDLTGHLANAKTLALTAAADLLQSPTNIRLALSTFTGTLDQVTGALLKPAIFTRQGQTISLTPLVLALNKQARIEAGGTLDRGGLTLALKIRDLPLAPITRLVTLPPALKINTGTLGLALTLQGPLAGPTGQAVATVTDVRLVGMANRPPLSASVSADLANPPSGSVLAVKGRLDGAAILGFAGNIPLTFFPDGTVTIAPDRPLAGLLEGEGGMTSLTPFLGLDEARLGGRYRLALTLGGTGAAPQAGGTLQITDGVYDDPALGLAVRGIQLDLVGDNQSFTVRRFMATDTGKGNAMLKGGIALSSAPILDLRFDFNDFSIATPDGIAARSSGALTIGGPLTHPGIAGTITVDAADLAIPDELPASIVKLDVVRINSKTSGKSAADTLAKPDPTSIASSVFIADLDLDLRIPRRTFVRGRGLDSEWRGDLHLAGTTAKPAITGQFETVSGTYDILGKSFRLKRGVLTFQGDNTPRLDLLAEAQAGDVTAQIQIEGDPTQPKLKLSATPELPSDEVLARILFGTGLGQITPAQGLQLAQAAATLAGGGPTVLDRVRRFIGLDRLSFGQTDTPKTAAQTAADSKGSLDGATVSAGKYVAPGVFIGVDQGASVGSSRARIEVEIAPNVIVNGTAGAETGSNSLGLSYKRDF